MCTGLVEIWRRKLKKRLTNTVEKPFPASATTTTPRAPAPVYKQPPYTRPDVHTTAAVAAMDSTPVANKENPVVVITPSKPAPSATYLSAPKPSYGSGTKPSGTSSSNSHSGGTTSSRTGFTSYHSSSSGGGGGGSCGGGGGGGGSCGGGGGGGCG